MKEKYLESLKDYDKLSNICTQLSINTHKRIVETWREEYGSYIFAKIVAHSIAILKLLPNSKLFELPNNFRVWDISSLAVLVRALIDTYNSFYYLIIDEVDETELNFRYLIWHLHSENERLRMLRALGSVNPAINEIEKNIEEYKGKLLSNTFYDSLVSREKTQYRKGEVGISLTNSQISERSGISINYYKSTYKYLSSYTHTYSFSINQIAAFKAGDEESLDLIKTQVDTASGYLSFAIRDYVKLFPDQESTIVEVKVIIDVWLDVLSNLANI
jgi:Family of unknown function (DUF5677)